jgi:uncharacterized protein
MKRIAVVLVFLAGLFAGALGVHLYPAIGYWRDLPAPSATATPLPMSKQSISPDSIRSGEPKVRGVQFSRTTGGTAFGGVWECEGPAVIDFTFWSDERLYVLEGSVEVDYLGNRFTLVPGDTALFRAGTKATWDIQGKLKKAWVAHDPGRSARSLSRMFK